MTGLAAEQVTALVAMIAARIGPWRRPIGRPPIFGLFKAVVLVLFLLRHNNAQDVTAEGFGCPQSTVSRLAGRRPDGHRRGAG